MDRTLIKNIKEKVGKDVLLKGWVQALRNQGSIKFLMLRDVSGILQCVILKSSNAFEESNGLSIESVVEITGKAKEEKQAPNGFEVEVSRITVLSLAEPLAIPVVTEKGGEETDISKRLDFRWIDLRKQDKLLIFKTWTAFEAGVREHFLKNDFIQIYTPSFMSTPSESGADLFEVKYFDRKAFLAQSPQFYKQAAMASGFEKVFIVGPVYRAELSFTTRHTTEFTGWDFEISFIESHHDIMEEEEKMIVSGFEKINELLGLSLDIPKRPFPRITMKELKEKLALSNISSEKDYDVSPDEERAISEIIKEEEGHDFVFITDWPIAGRPFYHMRHGENNELTKSFDLLYKGLEVTTGAQREHRVDILEKQAKEKGVSLDSIKDYLNFFRYGCPPHGGVGIGPGRFITKILSLPSVKEATFLPRDVKRLNP